MGVIQAKAEPADADGRDENVTLGAGPEVGVMGGVVVVGISLSQWTS